MGFLGGGKQKPPSDRITLLHWFYTVIWNGGGALIIAGGANYGIATGMYRHSSKPVQLWNVNNNTLAGDAAVTIFVEILVAWIIAAAMVCNDTRGAILGISPLTWRYGRNHGGRAASRGPFKTPLLWYVNVEGMDLLAPGLTFAERFRRLVGSAIRGLLLACVAWFLWWGIAVGIMAGIGRHVGGVEYEYNHYPEPQVFKLIFGGTLGLFFVPIIAFLALYAMDGGVAGPQAGDVQTTEYNSAYNLPRDSPQKGAVPAPIKDTHPQDNGAVV
ncbi:hypothetical protein WJX73_008562 [Symbiochloris irregularis]|uniref:Uncharacterized protein n=1 Tax=Symbiochloris irregularis TaxID=706552 RepID=A0AAW1PNP2_9CHLO